MDAQAEFGIKGCRGNKYYNLVSPRGPFTLILQMPVGRRVFFEWREFGWCCVRALSTCWESEQQLLGEREAGGRERSIVSSGLGTAEESNHFQITL